MYGAVKATTSSSATCCRPAERSGFALTNIVRARRQTVAATIRRARRKERGRTKFKAAACSLAYGAGAEAKTRCPPGTLPRRTHAKGGHAFKVGMKGVAIGVRNRLCIAAAM